MSQGRCPQGSRHPLRHTTELETRLVFLLLNQLPLHLSELVGFNWCQELIVRIRERIYSVVEPVLSKLSIELALYELYHLRLLMMAFDYLYDNKRLLNFAVK